MATANTERMVYSQIERRGIRDERVLMAMRKVERADFLPDAMREFAYEDTALPLDRGQTISQPYIVARMAQAADIKPLDRILEIGAGSGYAAAVFAELGVRVYAIERHAELAQYAKSRLRKAGYDNVDVMTGDGTLGWPEAAPFDVIIVSAGGPRVPKALKGQLEIGGRLIMPVGRGTDMQHLTRLCRTGEQSFDEEFLDDVQFVPLIGAEAWPAKVSPEGAYLDDAYERAAPAETCSLSGLIGRTALGLPDPSDEAFADAFERFVDKRVVLLGEASHGTSEFYRARAAITRRLIERHGFDIVAAEADWPDAAALDRHVRHLPPLDGAREPFRRFPSWMWRNTDVNSFVRWLRKHNAGREEAVRAGFFGLDIYSLSDSIEAVLSYLDRADPEAGQIARERYGCLTPWQQDPRSTVGQCSAKDIASVRGTLPTCCPTALPMPQRTMSVSSTLCRTPSSSHRPSAITGSYTMVALRAGTYAIGTCSIR